MQFAYTILYVADVENTLQFYEKAFGFQRKFITPDGSYGELNTGATTLSFAQTQLAASNLKSGFDESSLLKKPAAMEIAFSTNDVDAAYKQALLAGAVAEAPAVYKSHGQTVAYVRDPNGFLIEICTPMA